MDKTPFLLGNEVKQPIDIRRPNFLERLLGDLLSANFWEGVAKTLAHQAVSAFLITLGEVFTHYGERRSNKELKRAAPPSDVANRAFGSYQNPAPSPAYQSPSYPVSPQPAGDVRFPGFGVPPR